MFVPTLRFMIYCTGNQARSQDLEKGEAFLEKSKKSANAQKQVVFLPPKNKWSPKKKKKVFTEIETDFSAKIGNSNTFSFRITTSTSQLRHPISFGGAVFNFSPKIGLKSTKNVRFCILHKPMGGSSPPPPWLRYCR